MDSVTRTQKAYEAAQMYYEAGFTMQAIASRLRVSRSTVSRLLQDAREAGLVNIELHPPRPDLNQLQQQLHTHFPININLTAVHPNTPDRDRMELVAAEAAQLLLHTVENNHVVGVAWGTTMSALARHLPISSIEGVRIVQLNGAVNTAGGGLGHASNTLAQFGRAFSAEVNHFVVPAFFDHTETKQWLWRERSTRRILELHQKINVAVFGAGTFAAGVPSQVYSSGYLDKNDIEQLHTQGVVGDVCTVFLREDGTWEDVEMNRRCSGPTPEDLGNIPRRILVVSGVEKTRALLAALRAGVATDLVVDELTAQKMLELIEER